ncbi:hypothetical protein A0U93_10195 [Neoasaia chiangmaiensis]|uniref:HTH cro/C1-type domain-containing protein n=1 Tax=Neoasaia chiangmaiensis TaxID=320497 RepID=A0A1U9KUM2_9PROT|nr:hypothetical protein A0U93_10195 [Neoasaia chiangmaiensis]
MNSGNFFPLSRLDGCAEIVSRVLRRRFGSERHGAKLIARAADVSPRTARNWMAGSCVPRGDELMRLMSECDELAEAIFQKVREGRCPEE